MEIFVFEETYSISMECVDEKWLKSSELFRLVPLWSVKYKTWLNARSNFLVLKIAETFVLFDAQFDHIE